MKKEKKQNIFTFLILFLVLFFLVLSNVRIYQKRSEHLNIIDQLEKKEEKLEEKKQELEYKIERIYTQEHLEKIAREQLRLVKPGEEAVVIQIEEKEKEEEEEEETGFWDFDWLF